MHETGGIYNGRSCEFHLLPHLFLLLAWVLFINWFKYVAYEDVGDYSSYSDIQLLERICIRINK